MQRKTAPGHPGIAPTWTSSAKDLVGCALGESRIWFTLGFGIVNEVYYPRVDMPQIRDLGFIVADGEGFWIEVKRLENYSLHLPGPGTPAEIVHTHERFRLHLRITPDTSRDVLVVDVALDGDDALRPYVLLAPRLGATGNDNTAAVVQSGARHVLGAAQGPYALALAAVDGRGEDALADMSAGYVGVSDGWQDFHRNGRLTWRYSDAGPGNVAMISRLARQTTIALGFGRNVDAAATLARSALAEPFEQVLGRQMKMWERWHQRREKKTLLPVEEAGKLKAQFHASLTVLKSHCDKTQPGATVASLSIPWGNTRDDRGGYHLVWPRDLVQCATAFLAVGAEEEARRTLTYLMATQQADGHWHQNQWLDGEPYWGGIQLDEVAAPVLLASALNERDALGGIAPADMICRALSFIARTGPSTPQDRWE
ncbi:MAG: glycoside hydrolase family 15 protein, partial [Rhizomicrobium sp.]